MMSRHDRCYSWAETVFCSNCKELKIAHVVLIHGVYVVWIYVGRPIRHLSPRSAKQSEKYSYYV